MLKKICFIIFLFSIIVDSQNFQDIDKLRCIPNNECEYFENEENCPSDCSVEALQNQREKETGTKSILRSDSKLEENNVSISKKTSPLIIFLSILLIFLFLILVILLYSWIHSKDLKEVEKKESIVKVKTISVKPREEKKKPEKVMEMPKKPKRSL